MVSERRCLACTELVSGRVDKVFCSTRCQKRGQRGRVVVDLPVDSDMSGALLSTVDEARRELDDAGLLRGHLAASALRLARRIDESQSSVGYAPLVKELRDVMAQALANVARPASAIDDLKKRRDAKRAG